MTLFFRNKPLGAHTVAFWALWITYHVALFAWGFLKQRHDDELHWINVDLNNSVYISKAAGMVLVGDSILILLPVCRTLISAIRTSFLNRFIKFDYHIFFHKQVR